MNDRELKVRPGEVYFQEAMAGRYWYRFLSDREVEFGVLLMSMVLPNFSA